jgi:hypothetical protein
MRYPGSGTLHAPVRASRPGEEALVAGKGRVI